MRSAARGSPLARPRSASTTPTSVELRKIVALGHELRADDDVERAVAIVVELARSRSVPARSVESTRMRAAGKQLAPPLGEPLDAGAAGDEAVGVPHSGQASGRRSSGRNGGRRGRRRKRCSTSQAAQFGHCEAVAAGAAERERRIAATVEEEQRLLAALRGRRRPPRRAAARSSGRAAGASRAQVDRRDRRQRRPPKRAGRGRRRSGRAAH